jgi:hypothetical protein
MLKYFVSNNIFYRMSRKEFMIAMKETKMIKIKIVLIIKKAMMTTRMKKKVTYQQVLNFL